MLLKAFRKIQKKQSKEFGGKLALLLVPRHAERRRELIQWLESERLTFFQRSRGIATQSVEVCLADTTGELSRLVQIADLAYVGKSLAPNEGGQNPLDGAMAGVPIIYGDRMTNFRDICEQLERENAAIKVKSEREAIDAIVELFENAQKRQTLVKNVGNWFKKNQGASEKTYDFIRAQLNYSK
jgi:3-deoxy-D-manno-octulosonic-acid transferase